MDKYRMLTKKGEGTFSEVIKCQNVKDGTYWACKKMKQHYKTSDEIKEIREIQALRYLNQNPYILQLQEVVYERRSGTLNLIFELMDMNLYELMKTQRTYFTNEKVGNYMIQLMRAIEHLHRHGYFHRDIKPENILIKDDCLKLADFGSCRRINTKHPFTEYISTRWYRAPECLLTDGYYSYPMDIWSVGCVMFEIITLRPLFPGATEIDQIDKIHDILGTPDQLLLEKFKQKSRNVLFNFKPKKGVGISRYLPNSSPETIELINLLCTYDPDNRISAHRALKHRYFNPYRDRQPNSKENHEPASRLTTTGPTPATTTTTTTTSSSGNTELESDKLVKKSIINETLLEDSRNDLLTDKNNLSSFDFYKPILKKKKKQSSKGKSMMTGLASKSNHHSKITPFSTANNSNGPFSLSQLSNYSEIGNHLDGHVKATANGSSGHHHHHHNPSSYHQHLGYHNYLRSSSSLKPLNNITLPKLSNSTNLINTTGANSLHYSTFPTPALQSMFSRLNDPLGLPNLLNHYSSSNGGNLISNKLIGSTSVINSAKKYS